MRLIDADELMEVINSHCYPIQYDITSIEPGMTRTGILQAIQEQPTAHPEPPKMGKWVERQVSDEKCIEEWQTAKCSVCGRYHTTPYLYNFDEYKYCPNCGACLRAEEGAGDGND